MNQVTTEAFFDELTKIADLMTPAVVSDSNVVDGPPATPFVKKKGYKKLEQTFPKEAGLGRDMLAWMKWKQRKAQRVAGKMNNAALTASIKVHQKLPAPVQKALTNPTMMDPSDPSAGAAIGAAKQLLKVGSARKKR